MTASLRSALATASTALALQCSFAHAAPATPPAAAPVQGLYAGTLGNGQAVLVSLHAQGATLTGSYHFELSGQGWTEEEVGLTGTTGARLTLRETLPGPRGKKAGSGVFDASASADGATLTGTWKSADGKRSLPFTLSRAAAWHTQAVLADGGLRTCERPRFADERYTPVNRELAEACDYFLADGHAGPGHLRVEIDSLGQYIVSAVAYATSGGRELAPETIAVDLGAEEGLATAQAVQAQPRVTAIATRP